ncbi:MAG: hypothetical protein ACE5GE_16370 [Phycisphaerae bacterium]
MVNCELPLSDLRRCAADPAFVERMAGLYEELDGQISVRSPVCVNRGACCRFGEFGHRLFVTTAELANFLARLDGPIRPAEGWDACPYQERGRCSVRAGRPGGCRIFFCDSAGLGWQERVTEAFLDRIRRVHQDFGLPYVYLDWLAALDQLGEVDTAARQPVG